MKETIKNILNNSLTLNRSLSDLTPEIEKAAQILIQTFNNKSKVLLAGNGGSAADAQHIAAEMVVRFYKDRKALPAIALTTNSSIITASANDTSFENIFERQIEALATPDDCFVAITTSGSSPNILKAAKAAKNRGCSLISLNGAKNSSLKDLSDVSIAIPSEDTPRIQEAHILIGHIVCQLVEEALFS